jgi:hypothetical protein
MKNFRVILYFISLSLSHFKTFLACWGLETKTGWFAKANCGATLN